MADKVRCGVCGVIDSLSDGADYGLCSRHVTVRNEAERRPLATLDAALSASVAADADRRERAADRSVRRYRRAMAGLGTALAADAERQSKYRAIGARRVAETLAADAERRRIGSRSAGAVPVGKRGGQRESARLSATLSEHRAAGERAALAADRRRAAVRRALVAEYRAHAVAAHLRHLSALPAPLRTVRHAGASSDVAVWHAVFCPTMAGGALLIGGAAV